MVCAADVVATFNAPLLERGVERIPMENATPASAHMFIVNPLRGGGVMKLFSTHPPMEERIERLQQIAMGNA